MADNDTIVTIKQFAQAFGKTNSSSNEIGTRAVTLKQARNAMHEFFPYLMPSVDQTASELDDRCLTLKQLGLLVDNFHLYQELDYIEFPGNKYVNTGYYPNDGTRVVTKLNIYSNQKQTIAAIFGGRSTSTTGAFSFWRINTSTFRYDFGNKQNSINMTTSGEFTVDANKNKIAINSKTIQVTNYTFASSSPLYIASTRDQNTNSPDSRRMYGKIYYFKIYDDGVLVRDYIPVKRLSDNKEGLLDKVEDEFYQLIT